MKFRYFLIGLAALSALLPGCAKKEAGTDSITVVQSGDTAINLDKIPFASADNPLQRRLAEYCASKDARIGVAVVTDSLIYGVNMQDSFPLMSVVKFCTALTLSEREGAFADTLTVPRTKLHIDTWSPMMRTYRGNRKEYRIPVIELLTYAMTLSDNNAFDILTSSVGGPAAVQAHLDSIGAEGFRIVWDEWEMNENWDRYPDNSGTPLGVARLMFGFDRKEHSPQEEQLIAIMGECLTGSDRLGGELSATSAKLYHKTGTGGINPRTKRLRAINDAGFVRLPDGRSYAIAVFVAEASFRPREAARCIASISAIVYNSIAK